MSTAETVEDFAWFDDAWIDDPIRNIETGPLCLHETIVTEKREVLREVCLGHTGDIEEVFDRSLTSFQYIEDFETLRIGQNLVYMSIFLICLLWKW